MQQRRMLLNEAVKRALVRADGAGAGGREAPFRTWTTAGSERSRRSGQIFGVTRERIRQIEMKTLAKLRHPMVSRPLRDYVEGD